MDPKEKSGLRSCSHMDAMGHLESGHFHGVDQWLLKHRRACESPGGSCENINSEFGRWRRWQFSQALSAVDATGLHLALSSRDTEDREGQLQH